jgi:PilZ domain
MLLPMPPRVGVLSARRPATDRRRHTRLTPNRPSLCRMALPDGPLSAAFVHNLSASGVALFCEAPFPVGSQVRLALVNNAAMFCLALQVTVLRCQPSPVGDYFVAAVFERVLVPAELGPFIA